MNIILAIISIFVFLVGLLTFGTSSEEAHDEHNYEALSMSCIMTIIGAFCCVFFLFGFVSALMSAVAVAIVLVVVHIVIGFRTSPGKTPAQAKTAPAHSAYALKAEEEKVANAKHAACNPISTPTENTEE